MASTPVAGAMSSIVAIRASPMFFCVPKCLVVRDCGGCNTVRRKVLRKKRQRAHGPAKQVDDVPVQAALLSIRERQLVKINKRQKRCFRNRCVQVHRDRWAIRLQEQALAQHLFYNHPEAVDRQRTLMVSFIDGSGTTTM